jgi:hypothetical protein
MKRNHGFLLRAFLLLPLSATEKKAHPAQQSPNGQQLRCLLAPSVEKLRQRAYNLNQTGCSHRQAAFFVARSLTRLTFLRATRAACSQKPS